MKFWSDACVTPELEGVAHACGYEATSNRSRDLLTASDPDLYPVVTDEDWVFVTNNEKDFVRLAEEAQLHPGLVIVPQGTVEQQRLWFGEIVAYIESHASEAGEPPGDWMVCRMVLYDDGDGSITHHWMPEGED